MTTSGSPDLSRVIVVGASCSGKSTFARGLAERLGSAYVELDSLYWLPGWVERERSDFLALVDDKTAGTQWVTDGNYSKARDILWPRATAIIWLDYPFSLVLWRSLKRTCQRAFTREEICNGNVESWRKSFFSRESIILWVINTHKRLQQRYTALFSDGSYPNATRIRLKRPGDAKAFLEQIRTV